MRVPRRGYGQGVSYPDPRYTGPGEVSAQFGPASTAPDLPRVGGAASYLATGRRTGGRRPGPVGHGGGERRRAPHYHRTISESFFIVSGTVRLYDGARWFDSGPGDFVDVPEGGVHGFRNESNEPASMLILFAPGAPREAYFERLVDIAEGRWKPSQQELRRFFVEHDNIYL